MTSKLTREENVQAVFDLKAGYTLGLADVEILKRVARMALAAMDSESVAALKLPPKLSNDRERAHELNTGVDTWNKCIDEVAKINGEMIIAGHVDGLHPTTAALVNDFATALAEKLRKSELKYGYSNAWTNNGWMTECLADFHRHIAKGDPRDVAAYCAFMWYHGWKTEAKNFAPVVMDDGELRGLFDSWFSSDCSFDRSPEASEADNIAWRESYWYVWQCCCTVMQQSANSPTQSHSVSCPEQICGKPEQIRSREHFITLCDEFWNWSEMDLVCADDRGYEPRMEWDGDVFKHPVTQSLWRMYLAAPINSSLCPDDTRRMDWLVSKTVDVREPQVYGSHSLFWSQTVSDDWSEIHATTLREQIDEAMIAAPSRK